MGVLTAEQFDEDVVTKWDMNEQGDVVWRVDIDLTDFETPLDSGYGEFKTTELLDKAKIHSWLVGLGLKQTDYTLKDHITFINRLFLDSKVGRGFPDVSIPASPPELPRLRAMHTLFEYVPTLTLDTTDKTHVLAPESEKSPLQPRKVHWAPICGSRVGNENETQMDVLPSTAHGLGELVEEATVCSNCREYLLWHLYFTHAL